MLDVDGVLNAYAASEPDRRRYRSEVANGFLISWDQAVTDRVHGLHRAGRVEVRWLTTWVAHANTFIAPLLGWDELVVAGYPTPGARWWKLDHAVEVVEGEHRRLLWTDDDLPTSRHAQEWLRHQSAHDVLAIANDPATGLTHAELDRIERWLDEG